MIEIGTFFHMSNLLHTKLAVVATYLPTKNTWANFNSKLHNKFLQPLAQSPFLLWSVWYAWWSHDVQCEENEAAKDRLEWYTRDWVVTPGACMRACMKIDNM